MALLLPNLVWGAYTSSPSYSTVESMPPQMTDTHDSFTSQTFTLERVVVKLAVIILILNPVTVQYVLLW